MKDIELLKEKIKNYFKSKNGIITVYLFGSNAKGKEYHSSDIDIGILLDRNFFEYQEYKKTIIKKSIVELGRILRNDIHPVILNSAGEELLRQIFSNGECLLINDPEESSRFKMVMFPRITDFAYYRDKMQSGLIKKVMKG
ncbi:MAG: type VII toxin-antitoxin system MntA family adenylyltransferase antitoxin [bacterium]